MLALLPASLSAILSTLRPAKPARQVDDHAYQQNQAKTAATDNGASDIEPAATQQEKKNNDD